MGGVTSALGLGGSDAGEEAAEASVYGSELQADAQREALAYLKETEAIPQAFREGALKKLGGIYGLEGGEGSQQELIDQAKESPLYTAMLEGGEDAALRTRSMTGGMRSGGAISDVKDVQNQALLTSYNQQLSGLSGLSGLPSLAPAIAQQTSAIGTTLGQGQIAAAQAQMAGNQAGVNNMMGMGQLGLQAYSAFSDINLKSNVVFIGRRNGHKRYSWDWSEEAQELGLSGSDVGYMAHEVYETNPEVIGEYNGYLTIDVKALEAA